METKAGELCSQDHDKDDVTVTRRTEERALVDGDQY